MACWLQFHVDVHGTVRKLLNPGSTTPEYAPITSGTVQIFRIDFAGTLSRMAVTDVRALRDGVVRAMNAAGALPALAATLQSLDGAPLRNALNAHRAELAPYFAGLIPEWRFAWSTVGEAAIQSDGTFSYTYWYYCPQRPDLYFEVVQNADGTEHEISDPAIDSTTYFKYDGSQSVDIVVDDPSAVAGFPPPPDLGGNYVWATAIGNTELRLIDGLTGGGTGIGERMTDHFAFGGRLSLQIVFSQHILDVASYYRWSYRFEDEAGFTEIKESVVHRYAEMTGGTLHLVPETLGPLPPVTRPDGVVVTNLFEIPNLGAHNWVNLVDPQDRPYAYFDTTLGRTPGKSGRCFLMLEIFDSSGQRVQCSNTSTSGTALGGPFSFWLSDPDGGAGSSVLAPPFNVTDQGQLVFSLLVENRPTDAELFPVELFPPVSGESMADRDCGFIVFTDTGARVNIPYAATQPANYIEWTLSVARGYHGAAIPSNGGSTSSGSVAAPALMSDTDPVTGLLTGQPPTVGRLLGTCPRAAFALNLYCKARITDGYSDQTQYDRPAVAAFALSPR
jgi:hypothetical protein